MIDEGGPTPRNRVLVTAINKEMRKLPIGIRAHVSPSKTLCRQDFALPHKRCILLRPAWLPRSWSPWRGSAASLRFFASPSQQPWWGWTASWQLHATLQ